MPWKDGGVLEERIRFVEEWNSGDCNMAELCRIYGVTRKTGYKWASRYTSGGVEALRDQSRAPHFQSNEVDEAIEDEVLALRGKHPFWGARKIRAWLGQAHNGEPVPAASTIGCILKRNGLTVTRKRRRSARPGSEPLAHADGPNRVWCADFKGWFRTGDGTRIEPLTITDGYSRYLLRCQAVKVADMLHSRPIFEAAFREYGLPERIRTDNGAPFGSNGESGLTGLSVWWIKLGIQPERITPGKPQQNGRHERMHRTLKQATAAPPAENRRRQQERFDAFRKEYNEQRPHEALGQVTPASVYASSPRSYPSRLAQTEYPRDWQQRQVYQGGQFKWLGSEVFAGHALAGEPIGLEPIGEDCWRVWFRSYEVGVLDRHAKLWRPDRWAARRQSRKSTA
jgi:transposase InsO family protein